MSVPVPVPPAADSAVAGGRGTVIILEGDSIDAIREHMNTLPFVLKGLMTLEYEEVYEI